MRAVYVFIDPESGPTIYGSAAKAFDNLKSYAQANEMIVSGNLSQLRAGRTVEVAGEYVAAHAYRDFIR